jgi:hypothetical protein
MQQALLQLQRLGERQAAEQKQAHKGPAASAALMRAGTAGCYQLLRALQQHMPPAAFLAALVALAGSSPADRVRRKALQLLATAVRDAAADAAGQPAEAAAAVAEAALSVCQPVVQLLHAPPAGGEAVTPLTKQMALAAVGAVAGAFGRQHPEPLLAVLPPVLAAIHNELAAVRGSALAATAALAAALGPRLVPLLPKTVAAVIAAVQSAAAAVTTAACKPARAQRVLAAGQGAVGSDSGSSEPESEPDATAPAAAAKQQRRRRRAPASGGLSEGEALELAAALAAVAALVEHLGAFLAPHLPLLLGVLLHPAVLQVKAVEGGLRGADAAALLPAGAAGLTLDGWMRGAAEGWLQRRGGAGASARARRRARRRGDGC